MDSLSPPKMKVEFWMKQGKKTSWISLLSLEGPQMGSTEVFCKLLILHSRRETRAHRGWALLQPHSESWWNCAGCLKLWLLPSSRAPVQKWIELCVKLAAVTYFTNTENSSGTFNSALFFRGILKGDVEDSRIFHLYPGWRNSETGEGFALAAGDLHFVQRRDSCSAQAKWMQRWLLMH